jgi:hypothetical protein
MSVSPEKFFPSNSCHLGYSQIKNLIYVWCGLPAFADLNHLFKAGGLKMCAQKILRSLKKMDKRAETVCSGLIFAHTQH